MPQRGSCHRRLLLGALDLIGALAILWTLKDVSFDLINSMSLQREGGDDHAAAAVSLQR